MNIFILSFNQRICAKWHCDQHIIKMIIEYAQLLSTAHRVLDGTEQIVPSKTGRKIKKYILPDVRENVFYCSTHKNHPCAVWVRESNENYKWLYILFCELCDEYTIRYNKVHLTDKKLRIYLKYYPNNIPFTDMTPFAVAMPDTYKTDNVIESYRIFYRFSKTRFATWKFEKPWFIL
jgi:hypothetical protein